MMHPRKSKIVEYAGACGLIDIGSVSRYHMKVGLTHLMQNNVRLGAAHTYVMFPLLPALRVTCHQLLYSLSFQGKIYHRASPKPSKLSIVHVH